MIWITNHLRKDINDTALGFTIPYEHRDTKFNRRVQTAINGVDIYDGRLETSRDALSDMSAELDNSLDTLLARLKAEIERREMEEEKQRNIKFKLKGTYKAAYKLREIHKAVDLNPETVPVGNNLKKMKRAVGGFVYEVNQGMAVVNGPS
ncbi:uncharacterized protein LAJ45_04977 [Morchella importuna]|uniref:uncharacterized protein n=1 Tax=Morchella importuna TaxID=1174673 RepID=UPI001E8D5CB4|nr:uncharacterized protein LAJ45_04977 [Morchella importuna]KAH8150796.1 hypothetical protein LAJ45_04977 [Morchella importuna]